MIYFPTNLRHGCPAASTMSRSWDKRPMQWRRLGGIFFSEKNELENKTNLVGGFKHFFIFTLIPGEMNPI